MNPRDLKKYPIIWTSNKSQPISVGDFRDIDITVVGTGTITVLGTASSDIIDFTGSSTLANAFAPMVIADLTTPNTYATSLAVSSATKIGEVNTNLLGWICVTRTADTVDAYVTICDNS